MGNLEVASAMDKIRAERKAILDDVIVWHEGHPRCEARHGTVSAAAIQKHGMQPVMRALVYFMGEKPAWKDKQGNLEVAYSAYSTDKVKRPWGYCGEAILPEFVIWRIEEEEKADKDFAIRATLRVGDRVAWTSAKVGGRVEGTVARILTLIHVRLDDGAMWRVPTSMLTKVSAPTLATSLDRNALDKLLSPEQRAALKAAGLL